MMRFHSAVLTRLPHAARVNTLRLVLFRVLLLLGVCLGVLALVVAVGLRVLPEENATLLYRIHDEVYLPLVGHTFTRFFPWSVIWWGLIVTWLAWLTLMWTFNTAPLRFVQRRLLLRAVRRPAHRPNLLKWARRLARLRLRPHLLRIIADHEWNRTLQAQKPDTETARHLLTLRIGLLDCYPHDEARTLSLLEDWVRLARYVYQEDTSRDRWDQMAEDLAHLASLQDVGTPEEPFSPTALYADSQRLLGWLQAPDQPDTTLLQSNDTRRQMLNTVYTYLHHTLNGRKAAGQLPLPAVETGTSLPYCGRIALRLALLTAYLGDYPAHVRAYFDASERLALLARTLQSPAARYWRTLLGKTHSGTAPHDVYAEVARLNARELQASRGYWYERRTSKDHPLLHTTDVRTARHIDVEDMLNAAYPEATQIIANKDE